MSAPDHGALRHTALSDAFFDKHLHSKDRLLNKTIIKGRLLRTDDRSLSRLIMPAISTGWVF